MPGADGFPAEWYKTFRDSIAPTLKNCFNQNLKVGQTPPSWKQTVISFIPKTGTDKTKCHSYRPISILTVDYRLFASILARRMENILPDLTDTDQTGFVKNKLLTT